jgi:outer membrane protein insertion porin family
MTPRRLWVAAALIILFFRLGAAGSALAGAPDVVSGVDLASPHQIPADLVGAAIGDLTGRPLSRAAIRESLDRLWSLGLFAELWLEEISDAHGPRLRFHFVRRPFIRRLAWEGTPGLPVVDLAEAAGLAVGGDAGPARLEQARRNVGAAYSREGYFAAQVDIRTQEDPATNGRDLTFVLQAGARARIGTVELRGLSEAEATRFHESLKLDPGDDYAERITRERGQWLEDQLRQDGYFEARVSPPGSAWDASSNRVNIRIEVERGPKYEVEFHGATELAEPTLRARLTFKDSGVVDDTEVSASAREVEVGYREAGYHFVRVSGALSGNGDTRTIRFDVTEGPRVTVEAIDIAGNDAIPTRQLTERLTTRPPGILRAGIFRQDVLDQDLLILTALYRSQGFADVTVGPTVVGFSDDQRRARIVIPIAEGSRLLVGRRIVTGARIRSPREVLAAVPFNVGDPWTAQKGTEAQRAIGRLYAQRGFLDTQITLQTTPTEDGHVEVALHIHEGAPTRVGRILVSGLIATREEVVRREIPFKPGDPFSPELLVETERRLSRLGLFERIQVGPLRPPQTPFADVEITLREGKPWRVEAGGGYGTDRGWRGLLEIGHDNLFGTGRSLSVREKLAQDGDRTDLIFRTPWPLGMPVQGDVTLFREQWQELGYKRQGAGVGIGIQRDFFPEYLTDISRLRVSLRYQLEWVRRYDIEPSLLTVAPESIVPGSQIIGRIVPALAVDLRDSALDPRRGSYHTLSVDLAGPYLGSQVDFVKSRIETAWYVDWLSPVVLALGARLGLATPYGHSAALPIEDRFFAGGSSTVRGYPQDKIGPLDAARNPTGGNALMIFNLESRFPVWRWLSGVVFVDTGAVTPEVRDLGRAAFKTGVGGGLRVKTPVGPLRLDVGYALNAIEGESRWQLYFGIGQAF